MSKGSKQRPLRVSEQEFADNWRRIFGAEFNKHRIGDRDYDRAVEHIIEFENEVVSEEKGGSDG